MLTKNKVIEILEKSSISPNRYSIYDGVKSDCVVLQKWGTIWKIYYVDERGGIHILDYSKNEQEAFKKILKIILDSQ